MGNMNYELPAHPNNRVRHLKAHRSYRLVLVLGTIPNHPFGITCVCPYNRYDFNRVIFGPK